MAFCSDDHACETLALLIRYLRIKGVPFDLPVRNPDESMRETAPTVMLNDLLVSNPQSWIKYGRIVYGIKDEAPTTTAAVLPVLPNTTPTAPPANPAPMPSMAQVQAMLAAGKPLDEFIAWLDGDAHHLRWQDAQSGQGLLHLAAASDKPEAVRLLLARGLARQQRDHAGRTPAQLLPSSHSSAYTEDTRDIANLLEQG
jgi:ankyrin repeat protein